jgi:creatinine amidohydrolase
MEFLENICDEAARNGFKKIIIFNMHGGNRYWIPAAITEMGGKGKDYLVMMHSGPWDAGAEKLRKGKAPDDHAGEIETSLALALHPECVDKKAMPRRAGVARKVPDLMAYSSVNWYSKYPDAYCGDARCASAEKGKIVFDAVVENLVKTIRAVKRDKTTLAAVKRFGREMRRPAGKKKGR